MNTPKNRCRPSLGALLLTLPFLLISSALGELIEFLPQPKSLKITKGQSFELTASATVFFDEREAPRPLEKSLEPMAKVLAEEVELVTGFQLATKPLSGSTKPSAGDIILKFQKLSGKFAETEPDEGQAYQIKVSSSGVVVESAYSKGVSYGTATLTQAWTIVGGKVFLPVMEIEDEPTEAYRSVMLDVARKPHSIGVIKQTIRLARLYKLRYIQLHLTDNEAFTFPYQPIVSKIKNNYSYTREELEDLVSYADARGVTLIPELDLPGHSARIKESGYFEPGQTDADIADPANYERVMRMIDDMLSVFQSSPYFHIGGDESAAGSKLVPFLEAVNKHLRGTPEGGKRRLIVWEGFHGAPTKEIPAKGDDRVIVMAWESSYNAPWDLLEAGYEIINSSWKPLYLAGGGLSNYPHNTGGKKFRIKDIYRWSKPIFMHWEPGRPIYDDRGPKDKNKDDGEWDARWIGKEDEMLGAQLQFWEQEEDTVMIRLPDRAATMAERLWNPEGKQPFEDYEKRLAKVRERVMTIVQPIEVLPRGFSEAMPITDLYQPYEGDSLEVEFRNRSRIQGEVRYTSGNFSGDFGLLRFGKAPIPTSSSDTADGPIKMEGGFSVCAQLFREDGTPVEGVTWKFYNNWPNRVKVTDYDIGRRTPKEVIDLASLPEDKILRRHRMPYLRGALQQIEIKGQLQEGTLKVPADDEYVLEVKSNHGTASLYLDLNQNGKWESEELLIASSPSNETPLSAKVTLSKDKVYSLRVDHMTGMPRPYLAVSITGSKEGKKRNISELLDIIPR